MLRSFDYIDKDCSVSISPRGNLEPKEYTRLLIQMLLLPLLALSILAAGLAYSLQRVQKSAAWVDHSDQVIAHANRLLGLIVDEETVSKELIEKQGGRLRVHSSISGTSTGTVFFIYLPSNLSEEMDADRQMNQGEIAEPV